MALQGLSFCWEQLKKLPRFGIGLGGGLFLILFPSLGIPHHLTLPTIKPLKILTLF